MKIGIDIDGTINASEQSVLFFKHFTRLFVSGGHEIVIITNRPPGTEKSIAQELGDMGIQYSRIVIAEKKADYIKANGVDIFFENEDEQFLELDDSVTVFKIRESFNFDFEKHKWVGSRDTTDMIDSEND